jgi:hypothetical protein
MRARFRHNRTMRSLPTQPSRRVVIRLMSAAGLSVLTLRRAAAEDALVQESDAEAIALDYKADAARVDRAKFPKYQPGQTCANCALYVGEPAQAHGGCSLFYGKDVAAKGWCSAWEKKPG